MGAPRDGDATRVDGQPVPPPRASRYRSFRRGLRANPVLDLSWRVGVLTVGGLVLVAGIALLALPGPGWATIFVGFMILASEFAWARRSLDWARVKAHHARVRATAPEVRRRNQAISAAVALVVVGVAAWYLARYGFPGPIGTALREVWER